MTGRPMSMHEFAASLDGLASGGLMRLVEALAQRAAFAVEDLARANVQSRLTMRSWMLYHSIRSMMELKQDVLEIRAMAGGDYQGIKIPYARLHDSRKEEVIRPVRAKALTIPTAAAMNGPGIPRYPSARQAPHLELRKNAEGKAWLANKFTNEVWYWLVGAVRIKGVAYLHDAVDEVHGGLPQILEDMLMEALETLTGPLPAGAP